MGTLVRTLKFLAVLILVGAIVIWFAARGGDRGYIHAEITIDRGAPVVFRWITTDDLLRRWIIDVTKLEKRGTAATGSEFRLEENMANQPGAFDIKIVRTMPNQEIDLLVKPPDGSGSSYISDANFKLFPDGDYTRLTFSS